MGIVDNIFKTNVSLYFFHAVQWFQVLQFNSKSFI